MDWYQVALIVSVVLLFVAGGRIKQLTKEVKDLVDVFSAAIADGEISKEELDSIIKEAKDVKDIVAEITRVLARVG